MLTCREDPVLDLIGALVDPSGYSCPTFVLTLHRVAHSKIRKPSSRAQRATLITQTGNANWLSLLSSIALVNNATSSFPLLYYATPFEVWFG